jgi:hypothetical protein
VIHNSKVKNGEALELNSENCGSENFDSEYMFEDDAYESNFNSNAMSNTNNMRQQKKTDL